MFKGNKTKTLQLLAVVGAASILLAYAFIQPVPTAEQKNADDIIADLFSIQTAEAAQSDYYLKIEGVDGESAAEGHKGEIDIQSFSWGVSNQGSFSGGGGGGSGKVSFQDISFMKTLDKASPQLFTGVASGKHYPTATFTIVADLDGDGRLDRSYYTIKLSDVVITSFEQAGTTGGDRPTESISLSFSKIVIEYTPQTADGKAGPKVTASWDLSKNVKV